MTEHDASIDVSGNMAKNIASNVLDALGVDHDDVAYIDVDVTTENGGMTDIAFTAGGPHAGDIAEEMLGGLNHDEHPPKHITVELDTETPDDDEADEEGDDDSPFQYNKPITEFEGEEGDEEYSDLTAGSLGHAALSAVQAYYAKVTSPTDGDGIRSSGGGGNNPPGVTAAQVLRTVDIDLPDDKVRKAMVNAERRNGVLDKRKEDTGHNSHRNFYTVNTRGVAFLAEHGCHDRVNDPIDGGGMSSLDGDGHPFSGRREGAQGRDMEGSITRERDVHIYEEPKVDEAVPPDANTRHHELLWELKRWADEHGQESWATAEDLFGFNEFDWPSSVSVSAQLSTLFTERRLVERKSLSDTGKHVPLGYRLNEHGAEALTELGEPVRDE